MRTTTLFLLTLGLFAAAHGQKPSDKLEPKFKPKFTIGKETTFATEPVDKDGYIDYVAALNERLKKGVTPENNAVVLLCKALGPRPEGGTLPAEFYEWLGIAEPPEKGDYFTRIQETPTFNEEQDQAMKRPWQAKELPQIALWLKTNEKPLAVVIEATKRPRYFYPAAPKPRDAGLMSTLLPHVQKCRTLASALIARAMLRAGEGRLEDAWQDLLACHRLGRLIGSGGSLIERLVGIAIDIIAGQGDLAFADHAGVDAKRLRGCLRDLQQLPAVPLIAEQIELGERFMGLDTTMMAARHGVRYLERLASGNGASVSRGPRLADMLADAFWKDLDWDPALRKANLWYDRLAAAMRLKDRAAREKQLQELDRDLKAVQAEMKDMRAQFQEILKAKDKAAAKGKLMGDMMSCLMLPAVQKVQTAADRGEQNHRNVLVAFALAIYHREHGRYPKTLAELAPKYLAEVPLDLFSGKPLVYLPSEKDYLLYSLGPNGQDDLGRTRDDEPPGDDLTVRMPLPKP